MKGIEEFFVVKQLMSLEYPITQATISGKSTKETAQATTSTKFDKSIKSYESKKKFCLQELNKKYLIYLLRSTSKMIIIMILSLKHPLKFFLVISIVM